MARGCRSIAKHLDDGDQHAEPWTLNTAADLLWSFMFPEMLKRLTGERDCSTERYGEPLAVVMRRTLVAS